MILSYGNFLQALLQAGFSMGGGNNEGIYSIVNWNWNEEPPYSTPVRWHTGDKETDPWEWRMRVLEERDDIAYGKFFFNKGGFVTKEWLPFFLAARHGGSMFLHEYQEGHCSQMSKHIYELIYQKKTVAAHDIKPLLELGKEEQKDMEKALIELQMGLFIVIGGRQQKRSIAGEPYGWSSTVFTTTEHYFGESTFCEARRIPRKDAFAQIEAQIMLLNPDSTPKKRSKFILG